MQRRTEFGKTVEAIHAGCALQGFTVPRSGFLLVLSQKPAALVVLQAARTRHFSSTTVALAAARWAYGGATLNGLANKSSVLQPGQHQPSMCKLNSFLIWSKGTSRQTSRFS
jgi:hypothetical protein